MEYFDDSNWIEEKYGQKYCNSGGAEGADTVFENECIGKEIPVIAWSFPGHKTKSKNVKVLTKEELDEGWKHIEIANSKLKRNIWNLSPYVRNLLARNWFQVKNSDTIFAVGTLQSNMGVKTQANGGTGWAVQMAIENNIPVYFFDQEKDKWYYWTKNVEPCDKFILMDYTPKLTDRFAGIGTRDINENGISAIKKLFENL